jgi:hypothetical protein
MGQQRGDPFEDSPARSINSTPRPPATPRAASNNPVTRTPGNLRRTTELRPTGGDIRPVAGDIRPSGNNVGVSGGGIRPVEVRSPLQNEAYYDAQLRPRTPRYGVTGFSVNSGWDDPPWGDRDPGRREVPRASSATFGGYAETGTSWSSAPAAAGGAIQFRGDSGATEGAGAATEAGRATTTRPVRRYSTPAHVGAASAPRTSSQVVGQPPSVNDDAEWFETRTNTSAVARARRDMRPEVRLAVRLTLENRYAGAMDTVRGAVYRDPEFFAGEPAFADAGTREHVERAIAAYRADSGKRISPADAQFMVAALSASIGDRDAARAAIRAARQEGESRPSGKVLHRVLNRGYSPEGAGAVGDEVQP